MPAMARPALKWTEYINTIKLYSCKFCPHRPCFQSREDLERHVAAGHTNSREIPQEIEASWPQEELDKRAQELNSNIKQAHAEARAGQDYNAQSVSYSRLMGEYFDCLQVSHRSTNPDQQIIASTIPDELWKECIWPCLDILERNLPDSRYIMKQFIIAALSTISELYETVPSYRANWTTYMGSLNLKRVDIEDEDTARDSSTRMAMEWYLEASERDPGIGARYINLAQASTDALQCLFYHSKDLCAVWPSVAARESLEASFQRYNNEPLPSLLSQFLKSHASILADNSAQEASVTVFLHHLDQFSMRPNMLTIEGSHIAIPIVAAMLGFSSPNNPLVQSLARSKTIPGIDPAQTSLYNSFQHAERLSNETLKFVLKQAVRLPETPGLWSFIHCILVFIRYVSKKGALNLLEANFPWLQLVENMNSITDVRYSGKEFPKHHQAFPEDRSIRGLQWAEEYHPHMWCKTKFERYEEKTPSLMAERKERIRWLGRGLAECRRWILYDETTRLFSVANGFSAQIPVSST